MNRKIVKHKEFIALLEILYKDGYANNEIAELINITPQHLSKIKSEKKNVTNKVLNNMKLLIYKSEKYEFVEPKKEDIVKDFDLDVSDVIDEGKYEEFMSLIYSYYDLDYTDNQIANLIGTNHSILSMIKDRQRNITDEILIRLAHYFEKVMPIPMFKKMNYKDYLVKNITIDHRLGDEDKLKTIVGEVSKFYDDKISALKDSHKEEIDRLNTRVDLLLSIIEKHEKKMVGNKIF